MRADCEKFNLAMELGWDLYLFTTDMILDKSAIDTLKRVLA